MNPIYNLNPSSTFFSTAKASENDPSVVLLPLPEKKGEVLARLIKLGICNEYGEVTSTFSSQPLQPLDLKEAVPIFQEIFRKRESLINQKHSLYINMGESIGTLTKWMVIKGYNNFYPRIHGNFVPYLLFTLLPTYAKRVFESLLIEYNSYEEIALPPKNIFVGIECERDIEKIMHVALKSIAKNVRLNTPLYPEKITKKVVENQLVEGEVFLEKKGTFSPKTPLQERGFVHLRLKERPETVGRAIDLRLFNQSPPKTFTANRLFIPLNDVLGLDWVQYSASNLQFRCRPDAFDGSPLQAFLDNFFGFIRGPGDWFELISLYVRGFTSMEREPFLEERTFEKLYNRLNHNPLKLAESMLEELDNSYPNDHQFHLFFLLNASISLFNNGMDLEVEILLKRGLGKLSLDSNTDLALMLLIDLIREEKVPFSLLLPFFQVVFSLMYISKQWEGEYCVTLKSEERRRDLLLLHIGPYTLQIPFEASKPFNELYDCLDKNSQESKSIQSKLLQFFLLLRSSNQFIPKYEKEDLEQINMTSFQIHKIADLFLDSTSFLLNAIGLSIRVNLEEGLPPCRKIEEILTYLDLHYSGIEERFPLQTFISEIVARSIGGLKLTYNLKYIIVDNKFQVTSKRVITTPIEEKKYFNVLKLASLYVLDLKELFPLCWLYLFRAGAEVNIGMDLFHLWNAHVKHYLSSSPAEQRLVFNALLLSLKKSASEGDTEASLTLCNSFKDYNFLESDDSKQFDITISDLLIFVTETLLKIPSDKKWIEPLSEMLKFLFPLLKKAHFASSKKREGGGQTFDSKYFHFYALLSAEYIEMLFAHANNDVIRKMCTLIGIENILIPAQYKGKIINVLCRKETLDQLDLLLKTEGTVLVTNNRVSVEIVEDYIPEIDYPHVISFLRQFISPKRISGALQLWRQYFELTLKREINAKEDSVIENGFYFIEYALNLERHDHDVLIATALLDFVDHKIYLKKDENLSLKCMKLFLKHTLHIQDIKLWVHFSNVIPLVLDKLSQLIVEGKKGGGDAQLFTLLSEAIIKGLSYEPNKFEDYAQRYWNLNSLSGVIVHNKRGEPIRQLPLLSPGEYARKKEFIEMMISQVEKESDVVVKIAILKMTGSFHYLLKQEIERVSHLLEKRREELRILFLKIQNIFDLREAFDSLKKEIELTLEFLPSEEDHNEKVELWKRAGLLLNYLKREMEKLPEFLKEKKEILADLDLKVKEGFNFLKKK